MEKFRDVIGYEGIYQVSNYGRVKSLKFNKEKLLKPSLRTGYKILVLYKYKGKKTFQVHQLVAMTFLGHQPCGHELVVDHINNNRLDNRVENLQILTNRANCSKDKKSKNIGVDWYKRVNKWRVRIQINNKAISLGYFNCELAAALAYQNKLKTL